MDETENAKSAHELRRSEADELAGLEPRVAIAAEPGWLPELLLD